MDKSRDSLPGDRERLTQYLSLIDQWEDPGVEQADLPDLFDTLVARLQTETDIAKGFLAVRENDCTRFMAIATFRGEQGCRRLSLKLPASGSLFEKVAESEQMFSENYSELFDGNHIEKRLLLDDDSVAYLLRPLRSDGQLVGLIGFSSETPDTFVTFELGEYDELFVRFGELLARLQATTIPA